MSKRSARGDHAAQKKAKRDSRVQYTGWEVPRADYVLDTVDVKDLTPASFYANYVKMRRPVVIKGFIQDKTFQAPAKWTNAYLKETAGAQKLMVEERASISDSYGQGNEVSMTFADFIQLVEAKDALHYLTTQDVQADPVTGRPQLMAPFVQALSGDFPVSPELMGHLIPQNINIWMGLSKDGSTSGLHHDYHDNLYILLRGRKKFRLYSPGDVEAMYTRGNLLKVHPNGRINYEGEETTAYGADLKSEQAATAFTAQQEAEAELAAAERDLANNVPGAEERVAVAEEKLERAMDDAMEAEFDEEGDEDDGDDNDNDDDGEDNEIGDEDEIASSNDPLVDKTIKDPINFSRVKTQRPPDELDHEFPRFRHAKATFCDVNVGEMLYLPASWFHEVISFGEDGHLALNYWYHPPDAADNFAKPYTSDFWSNDYAARESML
ncbi:unnamed protein product [Aphanomyces euteiches]|uniref:JmjC domain-containing protein n=1 Tax=Aphanomyces euteiches TaxID=100861 RepID=A0A6G0XBQ7_9STRA|nr:hypothetical protein Ae201684_006560 [Aphanomyces euteiches]KAH9090917.1 hypothetical protein Ae201684P_006321 [Aphanomyces euteiches]KAH9157578.1 hypothetical protein AeRB84_000577 [Aphanomyces euteiches]